MVNRNAAERTSALYENTPRAQLTKLMASHADDATSATEILDRAQLAKRDLTTAEAESLDRIEARMDKTEDARGKLIAQHPALTAGEPTRDEVRAMALPQTARISIGDESPVQPGRHDKLTVRALERDRTGAFSFEDAQSFSLGKFVRGLANAETLDGSSVERRALSEGTDSAGGYAVPSILSAQVIDRLQSRSVVIDAGARVIALDSKSLDIPRISTGITGGWRAEGAAVSSVTPVFDRVTLTPKSLACAVKISNELLEDISDGGAQAIERELITALSQQIDAAALVGTGSSNQPTGVLNTTGVTINTNGTNGTTAEWAMATRAIREVQTRNADVTGLIAHPRTWATLAGLADTTGQPLRAPEYASAITQHSTTGVPADLTVGSATTCSLMFAGDWSRLLIGVRPSISIRIIRDSSRYVDELSTVIIAHVRADIALEQPAAFSVEKGIK